MTPVGQLVWRNRRLLSTRTPPLFLMAEADELPLKLRAQGVEPALHTHLWSVRRHFERLGVEADFGSVPARDHETGQFVLFQPREKRLLNMMLDWVESAISEDGELLLVGEKLAGIRSAGRRLSKWFSQVSKADAARHCSLFRARGPRRGNRFDIERYVSVADIEAENANIKVVSLPGVFAHGRIDEGTRLLIGALTQEPYRNKLEGRVLDFACGSGVIGAAFKRLRPDIELTMLDNSSLALESAARTMRVNGLEAGILGSDGLEALLVQGAPREFDWIVSNPPFHAGTRQQLDTARRFITMSTSFLEPSGKLALVANVHLPYHRWLKENYGTVQVIAENGAYNVWMATGALGM